jgi:hypothetical protein
MATFSSIQYTIGTALNRAREGSLLVQLLVEGHWLEGLVVANDGHGVVLENGTDEHCVIRLERVSAVRVGTEAPHLGVVDTADSHVADESERLGGAVPMPGPTFVAV